MKGVNRVIVFKDSNGRYWYTLQKLKLFFFGLEFWRDVTPLCQPTYDEAWGLRNTIEKGR